jgi:outer membrane protein TolC
MKGQYENGLARKIDIDRLEVNIANLSSQRQQLLNAVTLLENQLKFLMGEKITTEISIPHENFEAIVPKAVAKTDPAFVENRTELQILKKQEELLHYQKESYKAANYPSLSLSGNYSYMGMGNSFPVFKGADNGVNWFGFSTISLNLRVPIFTGFANKSKIQQADISLRKNIEDQEYTRLALSLEYENAKTQINNNLITINNQRRNLELAKNVFNNTNNNYMNGLATLTDLLDAENSLTEANNNYSQALLDYRLGEIKLLKANGELETIIK